MRIVGVVHAADAQIWPVGIGSTLYLPLLIFRFGAIEFLICLVGVDKFVEIKQDATHLR